MTTSLRAPARWQAQVFAIVALITCCSAFVGLSTSGLWIDELFTVHLIHHDGGIGEVVRRTLTDTHPPFYYILLYGWSRLTGLPEWALRLPSAVFAVLAIVVFAGGSRRVLSPAAVAFACAVGGLSAFWFQQSQNARSYAMSMAFASALLWLAVALRRRVRANPNFPLAHWLLLSVVGLLGSLTHAYILLALGMTLLYLLLSLPAWRVRVALVITGLVVLACNAVYYKMMIHSSAQDLQNMWFTNSAGFFKLQIRQAFYGMVPGRIALVLGALLLFGIQRKFVRDPFYVFDELDTRWTTALAGFVMVGVMLSGIGVSLAVAPSYSDRNLMTCAPFVWLLIGRIYDAMGPRGDTRGSKLLAVLIALVVCAQLLLLRGRELPRTESWRPTAHFVDQLPGCAGQTLPVILPYRFGHSSPYFRSLAEHDFFGFYLPQAAQAQAYLPSEFAGRHPVDGLSQLLASRAANADGGNGCTLLAWGVHDLDEAGALKVALDLARQPGVAPRRVLMQEFMTYEPRVLSWQQVPEAYVFLAIPAASGAHVLAPQLPPVRLQHDDAATLGDRVVVDYLSSYQGSSGPAYTVDVYGIQRWTANKPAQEDFLAVHRLTCDPPTSKTNWDVWPNPETPGCTNRPLPTHAGGINGQL